MKHLPIQKQNSKVALSKTKSLMGITGKLLATESIDNSWMERLWKWADTNNVPDLEWVGFQSNGEDDWEGLPRNKDKLLSFTDLRLNNISLKEIPKEICQLIKLQHLDLHANDLGNLPEEISNLVNLSVLNLSSNYLGKIPKEIGNLTKLRELFLYNNNLTEIPKEIGDLINLTNLNLYNNKLTELPEEICKLRSLQHLYLFNCKNLFLSSKQKDWIDNLKENGCNVSIDFKLTKELWEKK